MANHKKAWETDDLVLSDLNFPNVPPANRVQPMTTDDLVNGEPKQPATGTYKYRCTDCNRYYDYLKQHKCAKK